MKNFVKVSAFAPLCLAASFAHADVVGSVGAANQTAKGSPPGGSAQPLTLGANIYNQERIETNTDGKAQIVFKDKSTMTVGSNASVTINQFVYESASGAGQQTVSIAKGVMRFVGGGVSHNQNVDINTPAASIAVRGGAVLVGVKDGACAGIEAQGHGGCDEVLLVNGVATISSGGNMVQLVRPGYVVTIGPDGQISQPFPATEAFIERFERRLTSKPGQSGGVPFGLEPTESQASVGLGNSRVPDETPWGGFGALDPQWVGDGIAQTRGQSVNQGTATISVLPAPPPRAD